MSSVAQFADLPPNVVAALRCLGRCFTSQDVIRVGESDCEVDWNPKAQYDRSYILPLILIMAAIDDKAAQALWCDVTLVEALCTAGSLNAEQKSVLWALADRDTPSPFDEELLAWIARFALANKLVAVNRGAIATSHPNAQHCVKPVDHLAKMPQIIRKLPVTGQIAAVAVLSFYNPEDTEATFSSKRFATTNPPVLEAFATLGGASATHLLRMFAAFRGW